MELVRQRRKDDCLSCVAAMAFGVSPDEYELFCTSKCLDSTQDQSFVMFAFEFGYLCGIYLVEPLEFGYPDELECVNLRPGRFFMGVKSSSQELCDKDISHAVYYEGGLFYDPALDAPHEDITRYKILSFLPVTKNSDHTRWERQSDLL